MKILCENSAGMSTLTIAIQSSWINFSCPLIVGYDFKQVSIDVV